MTEFVAMFWDMFSTMLLIIAWIAGTFLPMLAIIVGSVAVSEKYKIPFGITLPAAIIGVFAWLCVILAALQAIYPEHVHFT